MDKLSYPSHRPRALAYIYFPYLIKNEPEGWTSEAMAHTGTIGAGGSFCISLMTRTCVQNAIQVGETRGRRTGSAVVLRYNIMQQAIGRLIIQCLTPRLTYIWVLVHIWGSSSS